MKCSAQILVVLIAIHCITYVKCENILEHLKNLLSKQRNNYGVPVREVYRRVLSDDGIILGSPSHPSHLPKAEPILPGHTLLRPTFGMLKSALRFPHKEMENGFGVYGNVENLGVPYGNTNERIQYSGFRRMPERYIMIDPAGRVENRNKFVDWPSRPYTQNRNRYAPQKDFRVSSLVLDSDEHDSGEIRSFDKVVQHLQNMKTPVKKENLNVYYTKLNGDSESVETSEESSQEAQPIRQTVPSSSIYNSLASVLANVGFGSDGGLRSDLPDKFDVYLSLKGKNGAEPVFPNTPFDVEVVPYDANGKPRN